MPDKKQIYAAFSPSPLTAEQNDLYIDLDKVRGQAGVVPVLASHISLASGPTSQVLAGHKGTGKTTELHLLKQALETGDSKFFVVMVQSDDEVDRNDVDFPDVLLAVIRQIAVQLRAAGIELKDSYLKSRFDWLKSRLGQKIDLEAAELNAGFGKLKIALKGSPEAREMIRECLDPDVGNWLTAANDLISAAELELTAKGYEGLVVLIDDLDKMVIRPLESGHTTASHLFINRAAQLTGFACHTVYTIPLSLAYSHHEATIRATFGGDIPVVPMVKIAKAPPDGGQHQVGITCMKSMVEARLKHVGAAPDDVFKRGVLNDLIRLSGGQPDVLMALVRDGMARSPLPLDGDVVKRVRKERQREYARFLRREHWPIIEYVREHGQLPRSDSNEAVIRELLDSRAVLQYVNDDEWYGLNPLVADLSPPPGVSVGDAFCDPESAADET
ncbi:MAG: hypothetical protein ACYTGL_24720 [Planctomycetota bacterium]|jgi:hypothetical protein